MRIAIIVSTLNGAYALKDYIDSDLVCMVILINQGEHNQLNISHSKLKIVHDNRLGLSNSRNLGINTLKELNLDIDYVMILDDDISLDLKVFQGFDADFAAYRIWDSSNDEPYKSYSRKGVRINIRSSFSISSGELVFKSYILHDIVFDPNFGLGAKYPQNEENLMLLGLLRKGKIGEFKDEYLFHHPGKGSGYTINKQYWAIKKAFFRKAFGKWKGSLFFMTFVLKKKLQAFS